MNLMVWDPPGTDECIGGFGVTSLLHLYYELSNWMIGCDVSGFGSSRVKDWLYLGRNGMHGEVALCDGSTAMMVFRNRRYVEVTEDEDAESEGCPRYCLPSWQSAEKRNEVPDRRADIRNARGLRDTQAYPTAYLALGFTHNTLTVPVSTPSNVTGHSSLLLWALKQLAMSLIGTLGSQDSCFPCTCQFMW